MALPLCAAIDALAATEMFARSADRAWPHLHDYVQTKRGVAIEGDVPSAAQVRADTYKADTYHAMMHAGNAVFLTLCAMNVVPGAAVIGVALLAITNIAAIQEIPEEYRYYGPTYLASGAVLLLSLLGPVLEQAGQYFREKVVPQARTQLEKNPPKIPLPWIAVGVHAIAAVIFTLARRA